MIIGYQAELLLIIVCESAMEYFSAVHHEVWMNTEPAECSVPSRVFDVHTDLHGSQVANHMLTSLTRSPDDHAVGQRLA